METVQWKVEGMTCSNCALTISKYLEKEGMKNIKASPLDGDVSFEWVETVTKEKIARGIRDLGYQVVGDKEVEAKVKRPFLSTHLQRFWFCFIFTLPLLTHMLPVHIHWLMNPWVQLALCLPVYIVGMSYFGKSAVKSLRNGLPNMNVLIALGATAAFVYSLVGTLMGWGENYLFYETAATILTLVFFGNYMEDASIQSTQKSLNQLAKSQKVMANMIAFDEHHQEVIFPVENSTLRNGDLILIKSGEQVPADSKILWGDASVNEAIITGESLPITKKKKDTLIGGSLLVDGTVKAQVTAAADDSVLANILNLVKRAQGDKPPVQLLADRISAVFVPAVLGIAALAFLINYFATDIGLTGSIMRSIAILVIACPCAMGLATPAAVAVGLGRAARNGVLFRNATSLETFKDIRQVVFDKTGTLTQGKFSIAGFDHGDMEETEFKRIAYSLEKFSNHPIATSIASEWKAPGEIRWESIQEEKGMGMKGVAKDGTVYEAGSYRLLGHQEETSGMHNVYILKNGELIGWIDVEDTLRPEAGDVISQLKKKGIKTVMLSGDREEKCKSIAATLGLDEYYSEQTPEQKLNLVASLNEKTPTAMVGDGINDAPALAKASIGVSLSDASQIAMQTADVVLMNKGLKELPLALGLGKHTYLTIKQNLLWAFSYNIVAIPVAAVGLLSPTFGALVMGFSDVVLALNSIRLFVKNVK